MSNNTAFVILEAISIICAAPLFGYAMYSRSGWMLFAAFLFCLCTSFKIDGNDSTDDDDDDDDDKLENVIEEARRKEKLNDANSEINNSSKD